MSKGTSRLARFVRAPIRALSRARDFYVKSVTVFAAHAPAGRVAGLTGNAWSEGPAMQRSVSERSSRMSTSAEEDRRKLSRAASQSRYRDAPPVRRSQSVAIGRIDEDQPCDFAASEVAVGGSLLFPRSRSYAVGDRKNKFRAM